MTRLAILALCQPAQVGLEALQASSRWTVLVNLTASVPIGCYYLHQANEGAGLDHINLLISTSQDTTVTTGCTALFIALIIYVCVQENGEPMLPARRHCISHMNVNHLFNWLP